MAAQTTVVSALTAVLFFPALAAAQAPAAAITQSAAAALSGGSRNQAGGRRARAGTEAQQAPTARAERSLAVAEDDGPSAFRLFVEAGLAPNLRVNFIAPNDVAADEVETACAAAAGAEAAGYDTGTTMSCNFAQDQQFHAVRGTAGLSYGALTLMGGLTKSIESEVDYLDLNLGARLETSWDSFFSVQFEFAYVMRQGDLAADGGRAGLGIVLRPLNWFAIYGAGTVDVSAVPSEMSDSGSAIFSYSTAITGGARFELGG